MTMCRHEFYTRHRGPYVLQIVRTRVGTHKGRYACEVCLLPGRVDGMDVAAEASALMTDPRDTIEAVYVWSEPEQQHVMTYRREAICES